MLRLHAYLTHAAPTCRPTPRNSLSPKTSLSRVFASQRVSGNSRSIASQTTQGGNRCVPMRTKLIGWIGVAVDAVLRPLDHRVDDWLRRRKLHVGHPHRDDAAQPRKKESRACPPVRALRESVPAQSSTADGSGGSGIGMCGRQADEALEPRAGWTQQKDAAGHTPISGTRN